MCSRNRFCRAAHTIRSSCHPNTLGIMYQPQIWHYPVHLKKVDRCGRQHQNIVVANAFQSLDVRQTTPGRECEESGTFEGGNQIPDGDQSTRPFQPPDLNIFKGVQPGENQRSQRSENSPDLHFERDQMISAVRKSDSQSTSKLSNSLVSNIVGKIPIRLRCLSMTERGAMKIAELIM